MVHSRVNPLTIDITLNVVQKALAAKYQNSILFAALVTLDANDNVMQYSSTYTKNT